MTGVRVRAAPFGILFLLALPLSGSHASSQIVDDSGLAAFYGAVVDSITVTGNENTKDYVILREMETRPGQVLEEHIIRRDIHFIEDLSPFAEVTVRADSLAPGHCALRIRVVERRGLFLKSILPFLKYNFETGLTYGVRWNDKNFRGRLEQLGLTVTRNQREDEEVSFSWNAPWLGWRHIALGAGVSYYNRGDVPAEVSVLERVGYSTFLALPLTESRIRFSQARGTLTVAKVRNGAAGEPFTRELNLSPSVGYRFDSRDSRVRPRAGGTFAIDLGATYPLDNHRDPFYRVVNEVRVFRSTGRKTVLALLSNFVYQFGDFPDYADVRLGGARTLRGHPEARFIGFHRWYQTIEWRYQYIPRKVFSVPFVRQVDVGLAIVTFLDGGIVWNDASDFDFEHYHGTGGIGFRFYNPIRDVLRLDFGFNLRGDARFHWGTGIRF